MQRFLQPSVPYGQKESPQRDRAEPGPELVSCSVWQAASALGLGLIVTLVLTLALVPAALVRNYGTMDGGSPLHRVIIPVLLIQEFTLCAVSFWALRRGWSRMCLLRTGIDVGGMDWFPWRRLLMGQLSPGPVIVTGLAAGLVAAAAGSLVLALTEWLRRVIGGQVQPLPPTALDTMRDIHASIGDKPAGLWIIAALGLLAVIAPITEELLFRGVFLGALRRRTGSCALVFSAFLFAAFHFSGGYFGALFAIGLVLGLAYIRTGALGVSIIAHTVNNAIALALAIPGTLPIR